MCANVRRHNFFFDRFQYLKCYKLFVFFCLFVFSVCVFLIIMNEINFLEKLIDCSIPEHTNRSFPGFLLRKDKGKYNRKIGNFFFFKISVEMPNVVGSETSHTYVFKYLNSCPRDL